MARKRTHDSMAIPLHDPTVAAWRVYADWLQDNDKPYHEWVRAMRIAIGLVRRPRLVMMGYNDAHWHTISATIGPQANNWPSHPIRLGSHWKRYQRRCWWTVRYLRQQLRHLVIALGNGGMVKIRDAFGMGECCVDHLAPRFGGTPVDYSDMLDATNGHLLWNWYWKIMTPIRVSLQGGKLVVTAENRVLADPFALESYLQVKEFTNGTVKSGRCQDVTS